MKSGLLEFFASISTWVVWGEGADGVCDRLIDSDSLVGKLWRIYEEVKREGNVEVSVSSKATAGLLVDTS